MEAILHLLSSDLGFSLKYQPKDIHCLQMKYSCYLLSVMIYSCNWLENSLSRYFYVLEKCNFYYKTQRSEARGRIYFSETVWMEDGKWCKWDLREPKEFCKIFVLHITAFSCENVYLYFHTAVMVLSCKMDETGTTHLQILKQRSLFMLRFLSKSSTIFPVCRIIIPSCFLPYKMYIACTSSLLSYSNNMSWMMCM